MDEALQSAIVAAHWALPDGCRYPPATAEQLAAFEREFGPIPAEYRWYLTACGGGVGGRDWLDGIALLPATHRRFRAECRPGGWTLRGVFVIGYDGGGSPMGINEATGAVLVEHFGAQVRRLSGSFIEFLAHGLGVSAEPNAALDRGRV